MGWAAGERDLYRQTGHSGAGLHPLAQQRGRLAVRKEYLDGGLVAGCDQLRSLLPQGKLHIVPYGAAGPRGLT
ncbi:hypothetical protein GCM10010390_73380 [Streptomyces mordarskii]|uniref:Uncharacterized protein n=1 Tax=Streptomyces mordarskii TaxID=1226758 RepID=A0ABP3P9Q8_9ACTN